MTSFVGTYRHINAGDALVGEGNCEVVVEGAGFRLIPSIGQPLALDLGDVDQYVPGEYELSLHLYSGNRILLTRFGRVFNNLANELLQAYRARLVECLLLGDLEEVERFEGWAQLEAHQAGFSSRAEIRLYRSNIAILPETAAGFSWRYADIDAVDFDEAGYALGIRCDSGRLTLTRLAKRTGELLRRLREGMSAVSDTSARVLHSCFPFLSADQFVRLAGILKEGCAAAIRDLNAVDSRIEKTLFSNAVDLDLREYLDFLKSLSVPGETYTGFKEIRREEGDEETGEEAVGNQQAPGGRILHWFFFPLRSAAGRVVPLNAVAWEATSAKGRATYFFRLLPPGKASILEDPDKSREAIAAAVRRLNRAIVTLNFRREPIYLPDDALEMQETYRRYAIACRRIPVLRELRKGFLGRALHTSPEGWQKQVQAILSSAS